MEILAPNKNYNGVTATIPFISGVGFTDDAHLIKWFKENGYGVQEKREKVEESGKVEKPKKIKNS